MKRLMNATGNRIKRPAEAGAYLALDAGNYADHQNETIIECLRADGARIQEATMQPAG